MHTMKNKKSFSQKEKTNKNKKVKESKSTINDKSTNYETREEVIKRKREKSVKITRNLFNSSNLIYLLGAIGTLVHFLINASNIADIIAAFIMAIFWPAIVTYFFFNNLAN